MQRLTGLDASFLYMETPCSPMHVAALAVYDPSTAPGGWSVERVKAHYARRLHMAAPFRRRLAEVPLGLHHPLWIEDPDFDLGWHIRHIAVPPPGGRRELNDLAARLNSLHLDRTRPLWEMWVIEGLEQGRVAVLSKVHHAALDGASANQIAAATLEVSPEGDPVPPPAEEWQPDHVPTDLELLAYAANSLSRQPLQAARTLRRTALSVLALLRDAGEPDVTPSPLPFTAPRTSFNAALTSHRSFATLSLSLSEVKAVKNALGITVNDVILGVCAGALRRYLDARGERPDGPLVAMVPISVRDGDGSGPGNRISSMLCSLATDIDDPLERLASIHEGMKGAKDTHAAIGADTLQDWAEFAAPAVAARAARLYSRTKMADRHRPLFNVTVSNIPGPPFPLYSAGARLVAHYPMGPIFDGSGLNMTVMSYLDQLDFGLVACADLVTDVGELAGGLGDALDELTAAVAETARQRPRGRRSGAARP